MMNIVNQHLQICFQMRSVYPYIFCKKNNCIQEVLTLQTKKLLPDIAMQKIINVYYLNQKKPKIIPINSKDFKTLAKRSFYSALSTKKFEKI